MAKELKGVLNGDSSSELIEDHDESGEDRGEGEDAYEDRNASTGGQFGEFRSADPELTLQILAYLQVAKIRTFVISQVTAPTEKISSCFQQPKLLR
ncbi:MAG: hypothetical protein R3B65_03200 [Candidatus Paceibacterota bacterium]